MKGVKPSPVEEFEFEEIPLAQAEMIVAAGDGNYSAIIISLSQKLPQLDAENQTSEPDKRIGYSFGLPHGREMDEKDRRALCKAVNKRLKVQAINWTVHYSGNEKRFICVPNTPTVKKQAENVSRVVARSAESERRYKEIMALHAKGVRPVDISSQLGLSRHIVNYHIYDKKGRNKLARGGQK